MNKLLELLNVKTLVATGLILFQVGSLVLAQDQGDDRTQDQGVTPGVAESVVQEIESEQMPTLETDWRQWSDEEIGKRVVQWMQDRSIARTQCDAWLSQWQVQASQESATFDRLDSLNQEFLALDPEVGQRLAVRASMDAEFDLRSWFASDHVSLPVPVLFPALPVAAGTVADSVMPDEFAIKHLQLGIGRKLVRYEYYDQALSMMEDLLTEDVMFPQQLLFYRAVANFKLLNYAAAKQDLELIDKHSQRLDRRMQTLTRLMLADLPTATAKPLDQVARLMDDAARRQSLSQSGKLVLDQERRIVSLLDEMIEQKEEQQKKQQQQQQQSQAKPGASKPMEKSMQAPLLGKGEVDPKRMSAKQWGDLPPEKQAEVIAEMTRKMPPHYRQVVEEYFRQLSEEK